MTDGYTGADVAALVNAAAMSAIKQHINIGKKSNNKEKLKLSMIHFEGAMKKVRRARAVAFPGSHLA
jgi:transitional endoplasmic reticulum ATPase